MAGRDAMEGAATGRVDGRGTARRARPGSQELFAAAIDLLRTGGAAYRGTARRYSLCAADAEDAYQRGLEILITKAPTDARDELRPWLHTVIKHEALALRRQRERTMAGGEPDSHISQGESAPGPEEGIAERERARLTSEALGQLKASELQCLLLKALGYSYDEIAGRTGFSWTKVNRSLTEGRKRFFERFEQIESGRRCRRFRPILSAACDGEASLEDRQLLRSHLRGCPACRAVLRGYRSAPARLAELVPPALVLPLAGKASWWSRLLEPLAGGGDRAAALGYKLQHVGETLSAQKAAAVVASTAALAGGAVTTERVSEHVTDHGRRADLASRRPATALDPNRTQQPSSTVPVTAPPLPPAAGPQAPGRPQAGGSETAATGTEFTPEQAGPGSEAATSEAAPAEASAAKQAGRSLQAANAAPGGSFERGAGRGSGGGGSAGGGEFGP
jgi:RNA polymerase sigma factor (sigma-70 family)